VGRGRQADPSQVTTIVRPAAAADVEAAYRWYERQRSGLGDEFLAMVRSTLRSIEANPEAYPVVHRSTRRGLVRRFPYAIFYRLVDDRVLVIACMHARRNPRKWRRRGRSRAGHGMHGGHGSPKRHPQALRSVSITSPWKIA